MATGTYAPDPAFTGFDNNGNPLNAGKLYTYAAGSSTPQATYSDVSLDPAFQNANPVILDSAGRCTLFLSPTSYKFILKDSADNTIWTRDNISAVPTTNVNLDIDGVAGEAISAGNVVYLSDGSGGNTAGRWYKADADFTYASTLPAIGMAPSDIASAATGSIRLQGRITGLSALVAGTTYYVSATAGALTNTAPTNARAVGAADTTTSLVIFSTTATQAASATQAGVVSLSTQTLGAGTKTVAGLTVNAEPSRLVGTDTTTALNFGEALITRDVTITIPASGAETTLLSGTVKANMLSANKQRLRCRMYGSFANNGNTKTLKIKLGATTLITLTNNTAVASNFWDLQFVLYRTGASAEVAVGTFLALAAGSNSNLRGTAAENTATDLTLVVTGASSAAAADVTMDYGEFWVE